MLISCLQFLGGNVSSYISHGIINEFESSFYVPEVLCQIRALHILSLPVTHPFILFAWSFPGHTGLMLMKVDLASQVGINH